MSNNNKIDQIDTKPITIQGSLTVKIFLRDRETKELLGSSYITRAKLAKLYHEHRVFAQNSKLIVEV